MRSYSGSSQLGRCRKCQINQGNRVHRTYAVLFPGFPLAFMITYVSDNVVLLTANRFLKAMETNIRVFQNFLTRQADIAISMGHKVEKFTNAGRYRLIPQTFVELVLITMPKTNRAVSKHGEYSLILLKSALLGVEYQMLYWGASALSNSNG